MMDYDDYIRGEWESFVDDPSRALALLEVTADIEVRHVLDVGCGAGQELLPFVKQRGAVCIGTDIAQTCGNVAREKYSVLASEARIAFLRVGAENLPFISGIFDVVICRLVLPYTNNKLALAEASRVLRSGGKLILKIHAVGWYLRKLYSSLISGDLKSLIHASRVLLAGTLYHLSRRQIQSSFPSRETFQSEWLLKKELVKHGLRIVGQMPDSNGLTPSFVILKNSTPA